MTDTKRKIESSIAYCALLGFCAYTWPSAVTINLVSAFESAGGNGIAQVIVYIGWFVASFTVGQFFVAGAERAVAEEHIPPLIFVHQLTGVRYACVSTPCSPNHTRLRCVACHQDLMSALVFLRVLTFSTPYFVMSLFSFFTSILLNAGYVKQFMWKYVLSEEKSKLEDRLAWWRRRSLLTSQNALSKVFHRMLAAF